MSHETPQQAVAARRAAILADLAALDADDGPSGPGWSTRPGSEPGSAVWFSRDVGVRRSAAGTYYAFIMIGHGQSVGGPDATSADAAVAGLLDLLSGLHAAVEAVR